MVEKNNKNLKRIESHLKVFGDRSVLVTQKGNEEIFLEGPPDAKAKARLAFIKKQLNNGWLRKFVETTISSPSDGVEIEESHRKLIDQLVNSITSEVGRALVGLTILQLTVKCIGPKQNIRLHKGGPGDFSWADGLPMRSLDAQFVTPVLREFGLLRLNIYGFMMTRSLAENYPYSKFYKAAIRGGRTEWLEIVEALENGSLDPKPSLAYIISILSNRSNKFQQLANETISLMKKSIKTSISFDQVYKLIYYHVSEAPYSARLLEVAMHTLLQVAEDNKKLDGFLLPLCQMRTANKKHRNVGDIEIVSAKDSRIVIEAWDAKFGKPYLRDELEELDEKLLNNPSVELVGFVADKEPTVTKDIKDRILELKEKHQIEIKLMSFTDWVDFWIKRTEIDSNKMGQMWLEAYVESLCQKRRDRAPIDEPSEEWVESLKTRLDNFLKKAK